MFEQLEAPLGTGSQRMALRESGSAAIPLASGLSGARPVPAKVAVNRPQQLLELAGKVSRASWGGIGFLSEGELVEHLTFGISDQSATELARSPWYVSFIHFIHSSPAAVSLKELAESDFMLAMSQMEDPRTGNPVGARLTADAGFHCPGLGLPAMGSLLGISLNCSGLYQAALFLARPPEQPAFDATDLETVRAVCSWLEQARIFDGTHLLTRLRLLNHVAQAAAGSLELERILSAALRELDRHIPLQVGVIWLTEEAEDVQSGCGEAAGLPPTEAARPWRVGHAGASCNPAAPERGAKPLAAKGPCPYPAASSDLSTTSLVLAATSAVANEESGLPGLNVGSRFRLEETPFATCLSEGQAVYGDLGRPLERTSRLAEQLARGRASAHFAVPLRAGDRTVGILQSVCTRPSGFTNEQIQLLYLVADLLGPAISNCRLFERLSGAYEELRHAQTQLIQTEKMRALGELAAGMAHDFNNSLCAVLGFLELTLLDKGLPTACRGYLESSRTCALDAAQTVHRVQDFARWQRNEAVTDLMDPNELVRQTIELTRHKWGRPALVGEASITVEQYTEATALLSGNRAELREVLTNLVFNAVDAMPQGGSLVLRSWSAGSDVFLSVQDTGLGISDAVRRRLFEPFFTTKGERGNGMGLSVSFGIIQRHNGEITVDSVLNRGSTFTIRLPAAAETRSDGTVASVEATGSNSAAVSTAPRSLRILIVEDEESIRRFLAAGLVQLGHRPRVASNAQEGLLAFAEEPFDVVVTDLGLPDVSGEEVARQVTERSPETPVVLLTGWADQIKAETRSIVGVRSVLGKPITLSSLVSTLTGLYEA
ncbi:MAG TPA: ATP-binding protein [Gemmataceae bacterium]|nr:ATP-binding protein [Gemmataceae bacterium]